VQTTMGTTTGSSSSSSRGIIRPGIVHRLDRGTSGLMVVAKSDFVHAHLCGQFKARTVSRIYNSLTTGLPGTRAARVATNILRCGWFDSKLQEQLGVAAAATVSAGGSSSCNRFCCSLVVVVRCVQHHTWSRRRSATVICLLMHQACSCWCRDPSNRLKMAAAPYSAAGRGRTAASNYQVCRCCMRRASCSLPVSGTLRIQAPPHTNKPLLPSVCKFMFTGAPACV
jgi:hypothetical protein